MTIDEMKARVNDLNAQIRGLSLERQTLRQRIADQSATWKVGDRVLWKKDGEFEITKVAPGNVQDYRYFGRKVLKSGTLHKLERELWSFDEANDFKPASGTQGASHD